MKLFENLLIGSYLAAADNLNCDVDMLELPDNAEKWDCGLTGYSSPDNPVPTGTECTLQCNPGFVLECEFLIFGVKSDKDNIFLIFSDASTQRWKQVQKCLKKGWRKGGKVDVKCTNYG